MKQLELFSEQVENMSDNEYYKFVDLATDGEYMPTFYKYDCWAPDAHKKHVARCAEHYDMIFTSQKDKS